MEQQLKEIHPKEDSIFYYNSSEDRIVLSHISVVAAGFGGDMPEELANELPEPEIYA